jgi:hypothetical protein
VVFLLFDEFPLIDLQDASGEIDAKRFASVAHCGGIRRDATSPSSRHAAVREAARDQKQGRVVDDRHVRTVDILPRIADVLGIKIPWHTDGTSALAGGHGSGRVDVAGVSAPLAAAFAQRGALLARQLEILDSGRRCQPSTAVSASLVPESAFRPGRNAVRFFVVTGSPTAPQLRELRVGLSS